MEFTRAIVWEKAMRLADSVLLISRTLPRQERLGLRDQMTRSATSIPSNIAEGWVRESYKEKVHFLSIAHGSLAELHTQLLLCERAGWLTKKDTEVALGLADEVGRMITALKRRWRQHGAQK